MLKPPDTPVDERIRKAVDIISPADGQRAACIRKIRIAIEFVDRLRGQRGQTPGQRRDELVMLCKVMHNMEKASDRLFLNGWPEGWPSPAQIRDQRKYIEGLIKETKVPRNGGKQPEIAREWAVRDARDLLSEFSDKKPRLTRDGAWHKLANILYGKLDADLFEDMRKASRLYR
jgi:hypothetical protein